MQGGPKSCSCPVCCLRDVKYSLCILKLSATHASLACELWLFFFFLFPSFVSGLSVRFVNFVFLKKKKKPCFYFSKALCLI